MKLDIFADGDGKFPEYKSAKHGLVVKIAGLKHGMVSGKTSVIIGIELDDEGLVTAEISLEHFLTAASFLSLWHPETDYLQAKDEPGEN